jgi:DNA-binding Lrp family transcriptional regulator
MRLLYGKNISSIALRLDAYDQKILSLLGDHARMPLTAIAKRVRLSKDALRLRVRGYEERGLVKGYLALVNLRVFGYAVYHLLLQLAKPAPAEEEKIIRTISALPFVRAVLAFSGRYDLQIALAARSPQELERYQEQVMMACRPHLRNCETLILTQSLKAIAYPGNLFEQTSSPTPPPPDGKDKQLLALLANDARRPLYALGAQLGLTGEAVSYRLKRLERTGIILKYSVAIDYTTLGYSLYLIALNFDFPSEREHMALAEVIQRSRAVVWCVRSIGAYNLLLYLVAQQPSDVHEFLAELRVRFPRVIRDYEALLASAEYKYSYLPMGLEL